jgi:sigma-B regulation protein RsbU (phosphoserine phosphatase)
MIYANAGHNRPLWYRAHQGSIQELAAKGIILGAFEDIELEEERIDVEPGDVLVFYTDGVTEAINTSHHMFGMDRLKAVLAASAAESAQDVSLAIVQAYNDFTGDQEQSDDVTFFVVKRS